MSAHLAPVYSYISSMYVFRIELKVVFISKVFRYIIVVTKLKTSEFLALNCQTPSIANREKMFGISSHKRVELMLCTLHSGVTIHPLCPLAPSSFKSNILLSQECPDQPVKFCPFWQLVPFKG